MDNIRQYYNPRAILPPPPKQAYGDERVYGGHLFWPQVNHHSIGYYPFFTPTKKVAFQLEDDHNVIFQHVPQFAYAPGHSNIDAQLSLD
jgi:hypothetical protein